MRQKAGLKITAYKTAWDSLFRRGGWKKIPTCIWMKSNWVVWLLTKTYGYIPVYVYLCTVLLWMLTFNTCQFFRNLTLLRTLTECLKPEITWVSQPILVNIEEKLWLFIVGFTWVQNTKLWFIKLNLKLTKAEWPHWSFLWTVNGCWVVPGTSISSGTVQRPGAA